MIDEHYLNPPGGKPAANHAARRFPHPVENIKCSMLVTSMSQHAQGRPSMHPLSSFVAINHPLNPCGMAALPARPSFRFSRFRQFVTSATLIPSLAAISRRFTTPPHKQPKTFATSSSSISNHSPISCSPPLEVKNNLVRRQISPSDVPYIY
jgi:hypothetical protein